MAKPKKHKKQHFVPACYLKAWCDPVAKPNETPYVWMIDKTGANAKRKAPDNMFHETDMYTIDGADGERILTLENGLSELENAFTRIRTSKLNFKRDLDPEERILLCAFVAAAYARTPAWRGHHAKQWGGILERMEELKEDMESATPDQRRAMAAISGPHRSDSALTMDDVRELHEQPLQRMMMPMIAMLTPMFAKIDFAILTTEDPIGFLTSDNPCVWSDPEAHKRPPMYRSPALGYKTIEISLPISSTTCLLLNRQGINGYRDLTEQGLFEANQLRVAFAENYLVSHTETPNQACFHFPKEKKAEPAEFKVNPYLEG